MKSEAETPNNFCPIDFLKSVQIFLFSETQICTVYVSRFTVHIALLTRKSRYTFCTDSRFGGMGNLDTLEKS